MDQLDITLSNFMGKSIGLNGLIQNFKILVSPSVFFSRITPPLSFNTRVSKLMFVEISY